MKRPLGLTLSAVALMCVVMVGLAFTGIWSPPWVAKAAPEADGSIIVEQGRDVTLPSKDGSPEINIPGSAISGEGRLHVKPAALADNRSGWAIEMEGAQLSGEATLIFKDVVQEGEPAPLVGFIENPEDDPQYVLNAEVSGTDLIVGTTHFSNWFTDSWDWLTNLARSKLDSIYETSGFGSRPKCERESEALAGGVSVTSDSGGAVQWCVGKKPDGSTVLKVNNSRGYAVSAESTVGLTMGSRGLHFAQIVPQLAKFITAPTIRGNSINIIGPGETVEYAVDPSVAVGVRLAPSPPAYLATALWFGIETITMVYEKVLGEIPDKAVRVAMDAANCASGFQSMKTAEVTNGPAAGRYLNDAISTVMACSGKVFMKLAKGKMLDTLAVTVAQVFTWAWSGIQTAAHGLAAAADTALNLNGYQILITPSTPSPASPSAAGSIPGLPNTLSGTWCTHSTPNTCFNAAEIKRESPEAQIKESLPSPEVPGATDYVLCLKLDLGDGCTTARTIYLRYFPAGVMWNCVQMEVVVNGWPACQPDYTSSHDSSQPRLLRKLNHQQSPNFIDSPPMYRTK